MTDLLPSTGEPTADRTASPTGSEARQGGERATDRATGQRTRLVLDTSVLIADPTCVLEFEDVDVIVPLTVVEELDGLKTRPDDVGRAARTALRTIEELRVKHGGSLAHPVSTGNGTATVQIEINNIRRHLLVEHGLDPAVPDNRIIGAAIGQADFGPTTMVSNDAALRIKAAHLGVSAAEHRLTRSDHLRPAVGWTTIDTSYEAIDCLYAAGAIAADAVLTDTLATTVTLRENEFAVLRCGSQSALVRCVDDEFVLLSQSVPEAWGLRAGARNNGSPSSCSSTPTSR